MRLAVFHNLPSGGAKRSLHGFVKYLSQAGHTLDAFVPSTANERYLPLSEHVRKIETFPVSNTLRGYLSSTLCYIPPFRYSLADLERVEQTMAQTIDGSHYDVVFSEQDQYTMSPFILKFLRTPTVYYCPQPSRLGEAILRKTDQQADDNFLPVEKVRRAWRRYVAFRLTRIDQENASFATSLLTNSYFTRESILRAYGLNAFVSYLGVDTEIFFPDQSAKGNYLLSVGRCDTSKGYDFLIRALGRIVPPRRPKLVLVSNVTVPSWREYLVRLAAEKGVDFTLLGEISDQELVQYYRRARLFLYAPYLEPFGFPPLEAMACGTPVVAVREGGVRESVIAGETGLLLEREERLFAEAVEGLLKNEKKRNRLSQQAFEYVQGFWTLRHAGERLISHLERIKRKR